MATQITLDIFSGRPNPTWELNEEQITNLKEKLYSLNERSLLKTPSIFYGLGYRGFIIRSIGDADLPSEILVAANVIDFGRRRESFIDQENNLENWLLDTAGFFLDDETKTGALKEINGEFNNLDSLLDTGKPSTANFNEPPYNPGWWNNDPHRLANNNCYNYGCNVATNTFAQPGRGSGRMYAAISCSEVGSGASRDGLITLANPSSTPAEGHYAALVVGPNWDFHWYRRDSNGMWSHKPGSTSVINYDQNGILISDPRTAARGRYTDFCGFYHVKPGVIRIL